MNTTTVPFDPRHPDDRTLDEVAKSTLLANLKEVQPCCGLQQFWMTSTYPAAVPEPSMSTTESLIEDRLWNAVIFWDSHISKVRNVHVHTHSGACETLKHVTFIMFRLILGNSFLTHCHLKYKSSWRE